MIECRCLPSFMGMHVIYPAMLVQLFLHVHAAIAGDFFFFYFFKVMKIGKMIELTLFCNNNFYLINIIFYFEID